MVAFVSWPRCTPPCVRRKETSHVGAFQPDACHLADDDATDHDAVAAA